MVYLKGILLVFLTTLIFFISVPLAAILAPMLSILIILGIVIVVIKMWNEVEEDKEN